MEYRECGKKWVLPEVLHFPTRIYYNWNERHFYKVEGYRPPKKDEYYLSGASIACYKAPDDLSEPYLVVAKLKRAVKKEIYVRCPESASKSIAPPTRMR